MNKIISMIEDLTSTERPNHKRPEHLIDDYGGYDSKFDPIDGMDEGPVVSAAMRAGISKGLATKYITLRRQGIGRNESGKECNISAATARDFEISLVTSGYNILSDKFRSDVDLGDDETAGKG